MKIITLLLIFLQGCFVHANIHDFKTDPKTKKQPNVIIIMTDDQGYGELSVHGNPILKTPQLDKLHGQSLRFTDFHVAPMCTPTRGQLITGIDAVRNGAVNVSSGRTLLRSDLKTFADYFGENGYQTGIFGKWHLGDNYPFRPQDRGFQKSLWFPSSHIGSVPDHWGNDYFDDVYMEDGERKQYNGYCTDVFFKEAMDWMSECSEKGKPFITYIPTNAPHQPFYALAKDIEEMEKIVEKSGLVADMPDQKKHDFIRYLAMIRNIDDNVGKLLTFLKKEKLEEDTILLFMTDNGSTFGPDYFNAGMRGRKTQLYEGGHRVPLFIKWPNGNLSRPKDITGLAQAQDILPTLLSLCGIETTNEFPMDGQDLSNVLRGEQSIDEDRTLFINYSRMPIGFNYPSPYSTSLIKKEESAILWKSWRLLSDTELYDLKEDPKQATNVLDKFPDIVKHLKEKRDYWWDSLGVDVNEPQRIIVGSELENPTLVSACEWLDVFVDQQGQIERGVLKNSYVLLDVYSPGKYTFELRRWPKELDMPLSSATNSGKAFPIANALIKLKGEGVDLSDRMPLEKTDNAAQFTFQLEKGPIALHTWFEDEDRESVMGAYYVYVTKN
jgi:arylsulfatase